MSTLHINGDKLTTNVQEEMDVLRRTSHRLAEQIAWNESRNFVHMADALKVAKAYVESKWELLNSVYDDAIIESES